MEMKFTDENFEKEVLQSDKLAVVDFYADWCGPCKMMAPIVEQLAGDYSEAVKVGKLNTEENQQTSIKYGVMSIPTILFFKGGEVVEKIVGIISKNHLVEKIESYK
ncbi:Thioredoxin [Holotrichia oblita]|nr:Thioredoxin [Holotrichia oblita]